MEMVPRKALCVCRKVLKFHSVGINPCDMIMASQIFQLRYPARWARTIAANRKNVRIGSHRVQSSELTLPPSSIQPRVRPGGCGLSLHGWLRRDLSWSPRPGATADPAAAQTWPRRRLVSATPAQNVGGPRCNRPAICPVGRAPGSAWRITSHSGIRLADAH